MDADIRVLENLLHECRENTSTGRIITPHVCSDSDRGLRTRNSRENLGECVLSVYDKPWFDHQKFHALE